MGSWVIREGIDLTRRRGDAEARRQRRRKTSELRSDGKLKHAPPSREVVGGKGSRAVSLAGVEGAEGEGEDGLEDGIEYLPHRSEADHAEGAERVAEMLDRSEEHT